MGSTKKNILRGVYMNVKIHQKLKNVLKVALLSATFFAVGVTATNTGANADDVSPAIYNSPNGQKGSTVTGNFSEAEYFTLGQISPTI